MENFKIEVDADGVALVTFDVPGRSMNTLTASVIREIGERGRAHQDRRRHQGRRHHLGQGQRLLRRRRPGRTGRRRGRQSGAATSRRRSTPASR
jgi:hypothetical protein